MRRTGMGILLLALFLPFLPSCAARPAVTDATEATQQITEQITGQMTEEVGEAMHVAAIGELNTVSEKGSHNGKNLTSSLEPDYRTQRIFRETELVGDSTYYPRLKKLSDGSYILFFQNGRWGPDIYYKTSKDLASWSEPQLLFGSYKLPTGDTRAFATADAAVLQNGDILVVCCYRSFENYTKKPERNGLMMRRSSDNGKTWSEERVIYVGTTWEPYVLQLRSGEIEVFFTHCAPYIALYGYNSTIRSTGSAIIRSQDNGETFSPNVTEAPFEAWRVMQCYIGDLNGRKIMNDQMPVAVELQTGAIAMACETQSLQRTFGISLGYSYDNFAVPLGLTEVGPRDRMTNFIPGVAPYLGQFPSGETVLSYTKSSLLRLRIGNEKGKSFDKEILPLEGVSTGLWASFEIVDSHSLVYVSDYQYTPSNDNTDSVLTMGTARLNHAVTGKLMTPVLDGDNTDWKENTDALFLGSVSQAQCCFRFARDEENYYILCDRLDEFIAKSEDETLIFLTTGGKTYYKITVTPEGVSDFLFYNGKSFEKRNPDAIRCVVGLSGDIGVWGGEENGWTAELAVPLREIGSAETLRVAAILKNRDENKRFDSDSFSAVELSNANSWFPVSFE